MAKEPTPFAQPTKEAEVTTTESRRAAPPERPPMSELNFGGSHIASAVRYGHILEISLNNGLKFSPSFPTEDMCKQALGQMQFAINTGTLARIPAEGMQ
jgi:hypothetical protein